MTKLQVTKKYIELNLDEEKKLTWSNYRWNNTKKKRLESLSMFVLPIMEEKENSFKVKIKNKMYLLSISKRCSTTLIKIEVIVINWGQFSNNDDGEFVEYTISLPIQKSSFFL